MFYGSIPFRNTTMGFGNSRASTEHVEDTTVFEIAPQVWVEKCNSLASRRVYCRSCYVASRRKSVTGDVVSCSKNLKTPFPERSKGRILAATEILPNFFCTLCQSEEPIVTLVGTAGGQRYTCPWQLPLAMLL